MVAKPDFLGLLRALDRAGVEYLVVGGVAAILEGAPITTLDLDIVYRLDRENIERLAVMLQEQHARYRDPAGRDLQPTRERLEANSTNLLETNLGPLDAMQKIGDDWGWQDLMNRSHILHVEDLQIRVLSLAAVIESKLSANREKDRAMLPVLRRTLEEK